MDHLDENQLFDLALADAPAGAPLADAHLAACPSCREVIALLREATAGLPLLLPGVGVAPTARSRLLEALGPQTPWWSRFADGVAGLLDVTVERARALLGLLDEPASWAPGLLPQMRLIDLTGGPAVAGAITGFVELAATSEFPAHTHFGDESVLVLRGRAEDDDGRRYGPGDLWQRPAGSTHTFSVLAGAPFLYLVVIFDGVDIGGTVLRPGDLRL